MDNKKVGFIYLDELHHMHHFLSPAIELSKIKGYDVEIITYEDKHEHLTRMLESISTINIVKLKTYFYRKFIELLKKRKKPNALYIYEKHKKKLLEYDALIFTDHTVGSLYKARGKGKTPKFIFVDHGAGDGSYGYINDHKYFDLILVAGQKKAKRLQNEFKDKKLNIKTVGYSKFDLILPNSNQKTLFKNANPIVLYCPHFKRELSSWYSLGIQILNYFSEHNEYNLIFAPHYNLFNKKGFESRKNIPSHFFNASNIHIDLGSIKSVDMTYVLNSDIYLGDVSSQVYEYMINKRPLIFINSNNLDWRNDENYKMWNAGEVINSIKELEFALLKTKDWPQKYFSVQQLFFSETFELSKGKSGERIAELICKELS